MLGYYCAYFRYYYTGHFITAFLNNAANDDDIINGTALAKQYGIKVILPKFGKSGNAYTYNESDQTIAQGVQSVKFMGATTGSELYDLSKSKQYDSFIDLLCDIKSYTSVDTRQVDYLIKIDFFKDFGNQRELLKFVEVCELFKYGTAKQIKRNIAAIDSLKHIIEKYATWHTKKGDEAKSYTFTDLRQIMIESEQYIKSLQMPDLNDILKVQNFKEIMGYIGYVSGKEEDLRKLFVKAIYPVKRKKDGVQFGYSIVTQSIGSGKESRMTVFNRVYENDPIQPNDIIYCQSWARDKQYFQLQKYHHIYN